MPNPFDDRLTQVTCKRLEQARKIWPPAIKVSGTWVPTVGDRV